MDKRGSRIHAVVELVCDNDELLSERVSTKLVRVAYIHAYLPPLPPIPFSLSALPCAIRHYRF